MGDREIRKGTSFEFLEVPPLICMSSVVSIIIPVYNVAPFLEVCLQSVADQTFKEWECILVDDGSTDGSGVICDNWLEEDQRFRVIHQSNRGVSVARNTGISAAVGKYVVFVDADDWVEETYLSDLLDKSDDSVDLILSGIVQDRKDGICRICPSREIIIQLSSGIKSSDWVEYINLLYGPYAKLYKHSVIKDNELSFPEQQSLGEDMIFNLNYLEQVSNALIIPEANYHYRIQDGNSLSTMYRYNRFEIEYDLWKRRKSLFDKKGIWNKELMDYMVVQLWGIVYNGIFNVKRPSMKYLRDVLSIPEIDLLKKSSYNASPRIRKAITTRDCLFFYILRRIKG